MSGDNWDELLEQARAKLREQDEVNAEIGADLTPEPDGHVAGRWRGIGQMTTKRGLVDVYLLWARDDDRPGFVYQHARLVQEVEAEQPQLGDRVLILRGPTETFEKDGESRTIYPYVLRREPCDDPLPGGTTGDDQDIPFLYPGGSDTRSASSAAAATASA
jgi:hypothetical protein